MTKADEGAPAVRVPCDVCGRTKALNVAESVFFCARELYAVSPRLTDADKNLAHLACHAIGYERVRDRIIYLETLVRRVLFNFHGDEPRWQEPPAQLAKALRLGLASGNAAQRPPATPSSDPGEAQGAVLGGSTNPEERS